MEQLTPAPQQRCQICAIHLPGGGVCGDCLKRQPAFNKVWIFDDYLWPLDSFIGQLKYAKQKPFGAGLAELFYHQHPNIDRPQALCPVPMHWRKQWRRGFNQSELLCQSFTKIYSLPIHHLFNRPSAGQDLIGLTAKARRRALTNCYQLKRQISPPTHIAIVDDVLTTGSTAQVLATLAKSAGVKRVDIWAIARTPAPSDIVRAPQSALTLHSGE
jgi:ComF family protein